MSNKLVQLKDENGNDVFVKTNITAYDVGDSVSFNQNDINLGFCYDSGTFFTFIPCPMTNRVTGFTVNSCAIGSIRLYDGSVLSISNTSTVTNISKVADGFRIAVKPDDSTKAQLIKNNNNKLGIINFNTFYVTLT